MGGRFGCDHGRRRAAAGEVAKVTNGDLLDALECGGLGDGGAAFGQAGVEGHLGAGVGEEEMLDDLLDGPLVGRGGAELGLGGVEAVECGGYFVLKLVKGVVHGRQESRYTSSAAWDRFGA